MEVKEHEEVKKLEVKTSRRKRIQRNKIETPNTEKKKLTSPVTSPKAKLQPKLVKLSPSKARKSPEKRPKSVKHPANLKLRGRFNSKTPLKPLKQEEYNKISTYFKTQESGGNSTLNKVQLSKTNVVSTTSKGKPDQSCGPSLSQLGTLVNGGGNSLGTGRGIQHRTSQGTPTSVDGEHTKRVDKDYTLPK